MDAVIALETSSESVQEYQESFRCAKDQRQLRVNVTKERIYVCPMVKSRLNVRQA